MKAMKQPNKPAIPLLKCHPLSFLGCPWWGEGLWGFKDHTIRGKRFVCVCVRRRCSSALLLTALPFHDTYSRQLSRLGEVRCAPQESNQRAFGFRRSNVCFPSGTKPRTSRAAPNFDPSTLCRSRRETKVVRPLLLWGRIKGRKAEGLTKPWTVADP